MRGRAFRRLAAAGVLTLAVSAIAGAAALANENPHINVGARAWLSYRDPALR